MKNYYDILEVARTADSESIKKSYRRLASAYHPDKYPENTKFAEDMMKQINAAFAVLSDPSKRRQYDSWLSAQGEDSVKKDAEKSAKSKADRQDDPIKTRAAPKSSKQKDKYRLLYEKYKYALIFFIVLFILGSLLSSRTKDVKPLPVAASEVSKYQIKELANIQGSFKLKQAEKDFSVNLYKDPSLGYYQLFVNGKNVPGVYFSFISKVHEIRRGDINIGYILQTECGGNGCGSAYKMIDFENKVISDIPIDSGTFYSDSSGIKVNGMNGLNKLGDPIPAKLSYLTTGQATKKQGNWIDQSISADYVNLLGKHPEDFFSNANLRSSMVSLFGENTFRKIRDRTQLSGHPIWIQNGNLLVIEGCMPHFCSSDSAITVINARTGGVNSLYQIAGALYSGGNYIVDEAKNDDGFSISAYAQVFDQFLSAIGSSSKSKVRPDGRLEILDKP